MKTLCCRCSGNAEPAYARPPPPVLPRVVNPTVSTQLYLDTDRGTIQIELAVLDAPLTVENFVALARRGYFDGLSIHRVVPDFVVQDGFCCRYRRRYRRGRAYLDRSLRRRGQGRWNGRWWNGRRLSRPPWLLGARLRRPRRDRHQLLAMDPALRQSVRLLLTIHRRLIRRPRLRAATPGLWMCRTQKRR